MRRIILICTLLVMTLPSSAQTSDFVKLLQGKTHPPTILLKDLNSDWKRFSMEPAGASQGMGGWLQMIYSMVGMGSSAAGNRCYTKGDTVEIADQVFLVTYKLPAKPFDISLFTNQDAMKNAMKPVALTPDTKLLISLINFKSSNGFFNLRAFDLQQELKESEEESKAAPPSLPIFGGDAQPQT